MNSLAALESEVNHFVSAIKHANKHLAELTSAQFSTNHMSTDGDITNPKPGSNTCVSHANGDSDSDTNGATTFPDTNTTSTASANTSTQQQQPLSANLEHLAAFTNMKQMWMAWGQGVLSNVETYLGIWDLSVSEKVRLIGLADRLEWYGVRGSGIRLGK